MSTVLSDAPQSKSMSDSTSMHTHQRCDTSTSATTSSTATGGTTSFYSITLSVNTNINHPQSVSTNAHCDSVRDAPLPQKRPRTTSTTTTATSSAPASGRPSTGHSTTTVSLRFAFAPPPPLPTQISRLSWSLPTAASLSPGSTEAAAAAAVTASSGLSAAVRWAAALQENREARLSTRERRRLHHGGGGGGGSEAAGEGKSDERQQQQPASFTFYRKNRRGTRASSPTRAAAELSFSGAAAVRGGKCASSSVSAELALRICRDELLWTSRRGTPCGNYMPSSTSAVRTNASSATSGGFPYPSSSSSPALLGSDCGYLDCDGNVMHTSARQPCPLLAALESIYAMIVDLEQSIQEVRARLSRLGGDPPSSTAVDDSEATGRSTTTRAAAAAATRTMTTIHTSPAFQRVLELLHSLQMAWLRAAATWPLELTSLGYLEWWLRSDLCNRSDVVLPREENTSMAGSSAIVKEAHDGHWGFRGGVHEEGQEKGEEGRHGVKDGSFSTTCASGTIAEAAATALEMLRSSQERAATELYAALVDLLCKQAVDGFANSSSSGSGNGEQRIQQQGSTAGAATFYSSSSFYNAGLSGDSGSPRRNEDHDDHLLSADTAERVVSPQTPALPSSAFSTVFGGASGSSLSSFSCSTSYTTALHLVNLFFSLYRCPPVSLQRTLGAAGAAGMQPRLSDMLDTVNAADAASAAARASAASPLPPPVDSQYLDSLLLYTLCYVVNTIPVPDILFLLSPARLRRAFFFSSSSSLSLRSPCAFSAHDDDATRTMTLLLSNVYAFSSVVAARLKGVALEMRGDLTRFVGRLHTLKLTFTGTKLNSEGSGMLAPSMHGSSLSPIMSTAEFEMVSGSLSSLLELAV